MATGKTWNGQSWVLPDNGDPRGTWGATTSAFLKALADNALSRYGGSFELTSADINFGATYGLVTAYVKSRSSNISSTGVVRLANTDKIAFRNNANGADLELGVSTSDRLQFGGVNVPTISSTDTLTNKTLTAPVISTISNTGTLTLPTSTDTLVGRTTTDTLTNKTISGSSNTITNVSLSTGVTGTLPIANGGTGQTTSNAALNALLPTQTSNANKVLTTDGSNTSWTAVATTVTTTEGDLIYRGSSADTRLAGNITTTKKFLRQVGTGSASAAPSWEEVDQVKGTTAGGTFPSGYIGEVVEVTTGATQAATTNVAFNVSSMSVPAGRWKIEASVFFNPGDRTGNTYVQAGLSTTTLTLPSNYLTTSLYTNNGSAAFSVMSLDVNFSSTTTVYLVMVYNFSGGAPGTSSGTPYIKRTRVG